MDERDWLAERFEANRTHLRAVGYRMLGSLSEADDAVQESWLRLSRSEPAGIENLGGWLTTVVARVSLDMLRSRAARREEPLGTHLPDPDVVLRADVGAGLAGAAREIRGARAVAGQALAFSRLAQFAKLALVNGAAGLVTATAERPYAVMGFMIRQGKVVEIDLLADPERLRQLDLTFLND